MTEARRDPLVQLALSRVESSCGQPDAARQPSTAAAMPDTADGEPSSTRGLINRARQLTALGRTAEARELLHRVFLHPSPVVPCDGPPAAGRPEGAPAMMRALATILLTVLCASPAAAGIRTVWAAGDGDKIKRDIAPSRAE